MTLYPEKSKRYSYKDIYEEMIKFCHQNKIKIIHCKLKEERGLFYPYESKIKIHKPICQTNHGCHVLSHEIGHWIDFKRGFFKPFFTGFEKFTKTNLNLAIRAEVSASRHGSKILKRFGKVADFEELDDRLETLIPFYRSYYFPK